MSEADYWPSLEYRLCHEFQGMTGSLRYLWCDGFIPWQYLLDDPKPRIVGQTWICDGPHQEEWVFTLLLPRQYGSREEIDWAEMFPPRDVTRWIALDRTSRTIEIEPGVAVPDLK